MTLNNVVEKAFSFCEVTIVEIRGFVPTVTIHRTSRRQRDTSQADKSAFPWTTFPGVHSKNKSSVTDEDRGWDAPRNQMAKDKL